MTPVLLFLARGGWKYLAAIALILGAYFWAHHRGVIEERGKWQVTLAKANADAAALSALRQKVKDHAEADAAQRAADYATARDPIIEKVKVYVRSKAAATPCPDAGGVQIGDAAIDAANAALAAH